MKMAFHLPSCISILVVVIILCCTTAIAKGCVERERVALVDFKKSFASFPQNNGILSSWNTSSEVCSKWVGILCDESWTHVVELDLSYQGLESRHLRPSLLKLQYLSKLDLSQNHLLMKIPEFITSFRNLSTLDLSESGFFGSIPPQLGNLSSLQELYLNGNEFSTDNFEWISHLSSLQVLALGPSEARDLLVITKLPLLSQFTCHSCYFPPTTHFNSSLSLQSLSLYNSIVSPSALSLFLNNSYNLSSLELESVHWEVPFVNIFDQIGNLCNLDSLLIELCRVKDSISSALQALGSGCASDSLEYLHLMSNNLTGFIPPMLKYRSLRHLNLYGNQVEGFSTVLLNTTHIFPPTLEYFTIYSNALNGIFLGEYFSNISQLLYLDLRYNKPNLTVSFNEPPHQIEQLYLTSCKLGPGFPSWLLGPFTRIIVLDISDSNLSGSVPSIFWRNLPFPMPYLNLSSNNLSGVIPNLNLQDVSSENEYSLQIVDLTSNGFYGSIPLFLLNGTELHLSNNKFSSFATLPYFNESTFYLLTDNDDGTFVQITNVLDISNNNLSGEIPYWAWLAIFSFNTINLSNNKLSGRIPSSNTTNLYVLNLSNNRFVGQIPSFLQKCTTLRILDLKRNRLFGPLPSWMGESLKSLVVLSLQSNYFTGTIPTSLCHLKFLQILDLSQNQISGRIHSCVNKFAAMAQGVNLSSEIFFPTGYDSYTLIPIAEAEFYQSLIKWKGMDRLFYKNLQLLNLIDLSSNKLSGEIPTELMSLTKLDSLDLSSNNLLGSIPSQIGQLKSLEYLNLSFNNISGPIPIGLADICTLSVLDVSHNKLSGRIPKGTQLQGFNSSDFTANSDLCGEPLEVKCPGDVDDSTQPFQSPSDVTHGEDKQWFYAGTGAGFACGFLGILATLTWIRQWRYAFFGFSTELGEWLFLLVALGASRISRKLCFK